MTRTGRPLWFLAAVIGGWTAIRAAMLWPVMPLAATAPAIATSATRKEGRLATIALATVSAAPRRASSARPSPMQSHAAAVGAAARPALPRRREAGPAALPPVPTLSPLAPNRSAAPVAAAAIAAAALDAPIPTMMPEAGAVQPRLGGGTWLVARGGSGESLGFGQLGGSQAGGRLTYALGNRRRVALSGRVAAPLRGGEGEAALGLDWRPTRLPVHLLAEDRIDRHGALRPAVEAIVGVALSLPLRLTLDGYGQAGRVARRGGFVDAAVRLGRSVAAIGPTRLDLGGGAWGGAQRGVSRLDLGPSLSLAAPTHPGWARLSLDWRVRVAGRASPGSGPALTLGSSF